MSEDKRARFLEKNMQLLNMAHEDMYKFKKIIKLFKSDQAKEEDAEIDMSFDQAVKNNQDMDAVVQKYTMMDQNAIDYLKSEHSMAVQNSKYIKIENNRERILREQMKMMKLMGAGKLPKKLGNEGVFSLKNQRLNLRFCKEEYVF